MDILLLVVTIVSLLIALFMGIAAWGMWREERARSAARVAALTAAAAADEQPAAPAEQPAARAVIRPVQAPVEKRAPWSAPPDWRRLPRTAAAQEPRNSAPATAPDTFGESFLTAAPRTGGRQRSLAIAACALFAAIVMGGYFTLRGTGDGGDVRAASSSPTASPLELISLRHERREGGLAITGLVRNPSGGQQVERLAAVAFLFDQKGDFITSSRAGVDFTQLAPGDESPFVIRLDAPAHVARYRVSFRTEAGVVPHIDRRGQEPIARDLP